MKKNFEKWHSLKSSIEERHAVQQFHQREIWWCSIGLNLGNEQDGKNDHFERPILILRKFSRDLFWGIPLSLTSKTGEYYQLLTYQNQQSTLLLSQLRTWSSMRLLRRIGRIGKKQFRSIQESIEIILMQKKRTLPGRGKVLECLVAVLHVQYILFGSLKSTSSSLFISGSAKKWWDLQCSTPHSLGTSR